MVKQSPLGLPIFETAAATAGTTQTQAGATALTKFLNRVTTGNASDGVALPRADQAGHIGQAVLVCNLSAVVVKVYPYYTSAASNDDGSAFGGTIDGGGANAALSQAASITRLYVCTAKNTWVSALLS